MTKSAFTKAEREEIKKLIQEALGSIVTGADKQKDTPDFDDWKKRAIKSETTGLLIAPEDYYKGEKKYFTWDEAMEALEGTPWRLPTAAEWMAICVEFGNDNGIVTAEKLEESLGLDMNGWVWNGNMEDYNKNYSNSSIECVGAYGHYWSASATSSAANAYTLTFDSGGVNPQDSDSKLHGFSVRCVAR